MVCIALRGLIVAYHFRDMLKCLLPSIPDGDLPVTTIHTNSLTIILKNKYHE